MEHSSGAALDYARRRGYLASPHLVFLFCAAQNCPSSSRLLKRRLLNCPAALFVASLLKLTTLYLYMEVKEIGSGLVRYCKII
jgi:hypothetical protein